MASVPQPMPQMPQAQPGNGLAPEPSLMERLKAFLPFLMGQGALQKAAQQGAPGPQATPPAQQGPIDLRYLQEAVKQAQARRAMSEAAMADLAGKKAPAARKKGK